MAIKIYTEEGYEMFMLTRGDADDVLLENKDEKKTKGSLSWKKRSLLNLRAECKIPEENRLEEYELYLKIEEENILLGVIRLERFGTEEYPVAEDICFIHKEIPGFKIISNGKDSCTNIRGVL